MKIPSNCLLAYAIATIMFGFMDAPPECRSQEPVELRRGSEGELDPPPVPGDISTVSSSRKPAAAPLETPAVSFKIVAESTVKTAAVDMSARSAHETQPTFPATTRVSNLEIGETRDRLPNKTIDRKQNSNANITMASHWEPLPVPAAAPSTPQPIAREVVVSEGTEPCNPSLSTPFHADDCHPPAILIPWSTSPEVPYYFHPYQFSDIAKHQSFAPSTLMSNPYDNRFFREIQARQRKARLSEQKD
jgi:hypothetical protein